MAPDPPESKDERKYVKVRKTNHAELRPSAGNVSSYVGSTPESQEAKRGKTTYISTQRCEDA